MHKATFPATFIALPPHCEGERAAFYLAAEEYVASTLPEGSYLFTWQLGPTVVMGRNQDAETEIDLNFCKVENIDIIRRKSGGGSVYADRGNIMTSLITRGGSVEDMFKEYAQNMSLCLKALGADVEVSGRNDITLRGGGKICGNAFYHLAKRNIAHGTMLYDTDARLMKGALTPERAKLLSKGVKSVESRIALLKDTLPNITIETLREQIRLHLTDNTTCLVEKDIEAIRRIEQGYYEQSFLRTTNTRISSSPRCLGRIEGCGTIALTFDIKEGIINKVSVSGDFFELADANSAFNNALQQCPFDKEAVRRTLTEQNPQKSIRGLTLERLFPILEQVFQSAL